MASAKKAVKAKPAKAKPKSAKVKAAPKAGKGGKGRQSPDVANAEPALFDPLTPGETADALRTLTEDKRLGSMAKVGRYRVICAEPLVVKPPHWMAGHRLARVVAYDYSSDRCIDACIDLDTGVVAHLELTKSQPMLSPDEESLATSIAMSDDRVRSKLGMGEGPQTTMHYWGRTQTDVAYARRSAAVIFGRTGGHSTLVAVVDLLDNTVTQVVPAELVMSNEINHANWKFHWRLTESAGIMIYLADYKGRRVLWEGSLPYVTVDHQQQSLDVESGSAETHGPWWVPLGTRTLQGPVRVQTFRGGIELSAAFQAGPYQYTQMWRFHEDGRLCPWLTIYGPGVHDGHTYHPHWRFDFDLDGARNDGFERFEEGRWQRVATEGWFPYSGEADTDGTVWRQVDFDSRGAINIRPHSWDDAEVFAVRYHDGEWAPYSPRSAAGSQPYPAAYVGNEDLDGDDVTLWYVAHVHFDQSFPYTAGPWIKVVGLD